MIPLCCQLLLLRSNCCFFRLETLIRLNSKRFMPRLPFAKTCGIYLTTVKHTNSLRLHTLEQLMHQS